MMVSWKTAIDVGLALMLCRFVEAQECTGCTFDGNNTAYCQFMNLTEVPDCLPDTLTVLDLWNNNIILNSNSFEHLPNLEHLHIVSNSMTSIPEDVFWNQPNLTTVNLNYNNLTCIPATLFSNNSRISELHVVRNQLLTLDIIFTVSSLNLVFAYSNLLENITSLVPINENIVYLDISYNNIRSIQRQLFTNSTNMRLWVENNPWNCDCELSLLLEDFQKRNISVKEDPTCATPTELLGVHWSSLGNLC